MVLLHISSNAQNRAHPTLRHTATLNTSPPSRAPVETESNLDVSTPIVMASETATSDPPSPRESSFLHLPCEIRLQIYAYVFLPLTVHCAFNPGFEEAGTDRIGTDGLPAPMLAFRITPPFELNADDGNPLHAPTTTSYDWNEADSDAPLKVHPLDNPKISIPQDRRWCPGWNRTYEVYHRHMANDRFRGIGVTCKQIHSETESLRYSGLEWSMCDPCVMLQLAHTYTMMAPTSTLASTERSSDAKALRRLPPRKALAQIRRVALSYNVNSPDIRAVAAFRPSKKDLFHLAPILKAIHEGRSPITNRKPSSSPLSMFSNVTEKHIWTAFWALLAPTALQGMCTRLESLRVWVTYHSPAHSDPPKLQDRWIAPMTSVRLHNSTSTGAGVAECGIKWKTHVAGMRTRQPARRQQELERPLEAKWCQVSEGS